MDSYPNPNISSSYVSSYQDSFNPINLSQESVYKQHIFPNNHKNKYSYSYSNSSLGGSSYSNTLMDKLNKYSDRCQNIKKNIDIYKFLIIAIMKFLAVLIYLMGVVSHLYNYTNSGSVMESILSFTNNITSGGLI